MNFEEYLRPFLNMDMMLHATQIIKRLMNTKEKNFLEIAQAINSCLLLNLSSQDVATFIDKINSYQSWYPNSFFKDFDEIDKKITSYRYILYKIFPWLKKLLKYIYFIYFKI